MPIPPTLSVQPLAQQQSLNVAQVPQQQINSVGTLGNQQEVKPQINFSKIAQDIPKARELAPNSDMAILENIVQKNPPLSSDTTEAFKRASASGIDPMQTATQILDHIQQKYTQQPEIDPNDKTLRPDYNKDQGLVKNLANFDIGVAKSIGQIVPGLLKLGGKIGNYVSGKGFQQEVDPDSLIGKVDQFLAPSTKTQKIGNVVGDVAQFFIPGGQEEAAATVAPKVADLLNLGTKGEKAASLLTKAGIAGTKDFTIAQTQGQSNKDSEILGGLGALGPVAEAGMSAIASKTSGGLINSLIKPLSKEFRFGRDPGLGVATEGITGNTLEGLTRNIIEKKNQIGQTVADGLKQADIVDPRKINIQPLLKPIDDAINSAVKSGDQTLVSRLLDVKNGLTKDFKLVDGKLVEQGDKNLSLSRTEANALKQQIGQDTKWTGQPFDGDVNQVRVKLYQNLNDAIDTITPGTKDANARYSNLLSAEKSAERTKAIGERQDLFGVKDLGLSSIAGLAGYAKGGGVTGLISALSTEALYKLASSTLIKSRLAMQLAKYIPEISKGVEELSPQIDKAISQELSTRGEKTILPSKPSLKLNNSEMIKNATERNTVIKQIFPAEIETPNLKGISKELQPLAKEATKYKSAEEFMKGLEKDGKLYYHGTKNPDAVAKEGFAFGQPLNKFTNVKNGNLTEISLARDSGKAKQYGEPVIIIETKPGAIDRSLEAYGLDEARVTSNDGIKILTKSQFTDIWNKANKK